MTGFFAGGSGGLAGTLSRGFFGPQRKSVNEISALLNFDINTPGFNLSSQLIGDGSRRQVTLERTGTVPQTAFAERFPRALGDLDTLRSLVAPGSSRLREARLADIANARSRSIGNLRDNLARRRVLGSSFGNDALVRADREFAELEAAVEAETTFQEIQGTLAIIGEEQTLIGEARDRELQEFQVASGVALNIQKLVDDNARIRAAAVAADEQITIERNKLTREIINDIASSIGAGFAAA